jgi:HTH-type transcriptional regulator/antitoxin HigA
MHTAAARRKSESKLDSYFALVKEFPLASIKNDKQFDAAHKFLGELFKLKKLDSGQQVYFDALCDLIQVYDDEHFPISAPSSEAMLAHLIEAKCCTQAGVSRATGISPSVISEILKGKRRLAMAHLGPLAKFFHVPASVFLPEDAR